MNITNYSAQFIQLSVQSLVIGVLTLSLWACDSRVSLREYEEIVTTTPEVAHAPMPGDPHAFMENLPPDHPDISGMMTLPEGEDKTQMQKALEASIAHAPLSWNTPQGWSEEKGSSMRLATFRAQDQAGSIECSIVSLGGQAGGLESNVVRWIKQLNIEVPPQEQLGAFLSRQKTVTTEGGFTIAVVDLSALIDGQQAETPSMIGAIAELTDKTIFVKMTGNQAAVVNNREKFEQLCQSLKLN